MKWSRWTGTILTLGLLFGTAGAAQAAGGVGCADVAKPTAPAAGPSVAQAAPAPRSYSYQRAPTAGAPSAASPSTGAPATARPAPRATRSYSYSPGYTNRANVYRVPAAPYDNSPRYLHADGKARGWHFRYSPTVTD